MKAWVSTVCNADAGHPVPNSEVPSDHLLSGMAAHGSQPVLGSSLISSRAALEREIGPQPVERHDDGVPEADQKVDVHDHPDQPSHKAAQPNPAKIDNSGFAPDGGEIAVVAIGERLKVVSRIFRTFDQATAPVCTTCGW